MKIGKKIKSTSMLSKSKRKKKILELCLIMVIMTISSYTLAFEQGVSIGDTTERIVRQEINPFIFLNKSLVLDPTANQILLILPSKGYKKQIKLREPEISTKKEVIQKTPSETEIGTITINNQ